MCSCYDASLVNVLRERVDGMLLLCKKRLALTYQDNVIEARALERCDELVGSM